MDRLMASGMILLIFFGLFLLGGLIGTIVMVAVRASNLPNRGRDGKSSYFDGGAFAYVGLTILVSLIDTFSLGFAYPWALCMLERWEKKHTVINGRRLSFDGKGIEIFGWNILWNFLSVITFGIFTIWRTYYIHKWTVKHTVYADGFGIAPSRFTGGGGAWFVHMLFIYLMTGVSFGFATPWAIKTYIKWQTANTEIGGSPLVFKGTGGQLFVRYLLWGLLSTFSFGLFSLFMLVFMRDWMISNTDALYATAGIQNAAHSHESSAMRDFADIKIAAGQAMLELEKSGITPETSLSELEELSSHGNAIAKYRLALIKKGDGDSFEGEALELLKRASDAGYHIAMYEYSTLAENEGERLKLLDSSARRGNMLAVRDLREIYAKRGYDGSIALSERINSLSLALYWFKIGIELGDPEAISMQQSYYGMTEMLSLLLCGESQNRPSARVSTATVVWTSILSALMLLPMILFIVYVLVARVFLLYTAKTEPTERDEYVTIIHRGDSFRINVNNLYRYPSSEYGVYDFEHNFNYDDLNDDEIYINGYLANDAYVDSDNGVTYIDFGISADSCGGDDEFCVYLVCPGIDNGSDGTVAVLCGVVLPGEKITKLDYELPVGEREIIVMLINKGVYNLKGTTSAVQSGSGGFLVNNEKETDHWKVYGKRVSVKPYSEFEEISGPVEDPDTNGGEVSLETAIIGHWVSAVRVENLIYTSSYTFYEDGRFVIGGCEYMHTSYMPDMFIGMPEGWQVVPMGYPSTSGTYTVDGDSIRFNGVTVGEGEEWEYYDAIIVRSVESEYMITVEESDMEHRYFKCAEGTDIEEVCNALGLPTAP